MGHREVSELTSAQVSAAKAILDWVVSKYEKTRLAYGTGKTKLLMHRAVNQYNTRLWDPGMSFGWHMSREDLEVRSENPFTRTALPKGWEDDLSLTTFDMQPDPACENAYPDFKAPSAIYQEKLHPYQVWLQQREGFNSFEDYSGLGKVKQVFP